METKDFITIGILILLILLSAFFSSAEMAFSSLNQIKLKHFIQNGNKIAVAVSTNKEVDLVIWD